MYPDIDYINEILWIIQNISYHVRNRKHLDEQIVEELLSYAINLIEILELYKNDKYDY